MTDLEILKLFREFLNSLRSTNSRLAKEKILEAYADTEIKEWLPFIYNYDVQFYVTSDNIKKFSKDEIVRMLPYHNTLLELLSNLSKRNITGRAALDCCNIFINRYPDYADIIYNILDKDLKCGVGVSIIKKYFANIKDFEVQLANSYDEKLNKHIERGFISRKIDGNRLLAIFDNEGSVSLMSRQGKPFETLNVLKKELENLGLCDTVLDGEVCLVDENGKEDFQGIMKEIRKKNHTIKNPMFLVFDEICKTAFDNKLGTNIYSFRYKGLDRIRDMSNHIKVLEQVPYTEESFKMMKQKAIEGNWEGLILRADSVYEGKRTNKMLKYKAFSDAEYIVEDVEISRKPMLIDCVMIEKDCIGSLIVKHKGYLVNVGSGLSDKQRLEWFDDKSKIVGKTITVKYFSETFNENGEISLRFPTLKAVFDGERDI